MKNIITGIIIGACLIITALVLAGAVWQYLEFQGLKKIVIAHEQVLVKRVLPVTEAIIKQNQANKPLSE